MIWVGFGMQVANTPTYSVICQFPVFVVLCDHNLPMLQTDGRQVQHEPVPHVHRWF